MNNKNISNNIIMINHNNNINISSQSSSSTSPSSLNKQLNVSINKSNMAKGVSFLEYVEVSGDNVSINHDCIDNINDNRFQLQQQQQHRTSSIDPCSIYRLNGQFHYEPLRPPAGISPLESISSNDNSSSPLSPFVSMDCHVAHHLAPNNNNLLDARRAPLKQFESSVSIDRPNVIYKPVRSLIQYWPDTHTMPSHISSPLPISQQQYDQSSIILSQSNSPHPLQINQPQSSSLLQCSNELQMPIHNNNHIATMIVDNNNLISKSSSSDTSDTNDSGTRLISDSYNDLISDSSYSTSTTINNNNNRRLTSSNTIDTIIENEQETSLPINDDKANQNNKNIEDIWIQAQSDLSKNLREKFLQNQCANTDSDNNNNNCEMIISTNVNNTNNNNISSNYRRKKNFKFRRIGCGRLKFNCPLSDRTTKLFIYLSIALFIMLAISIFICFGFIHNDNHYGNKWLPQWLLIGLNINNNNQYHHTRYRNNHQFDDDVYWYHGTTIYEIFTASFKDSNGDGFGDFNGIIERIDYLRSLGISAIRLNSIFAAFDYPRYYYNVLNFYDVDPHLGNFQSFTKMVKVLHSNQIRVILDINPTITSDEHQWSLNQTDEYEYYYFDFETQQANNKLMSNFSTSRTASNQTKLNVRNYENDLIDYSDLSYDQRPYGARWLNWSNEAVPKQMLKIIDFWLHYVDGIYLKNLEQIHFDDSDFYYDNYIQQNYNNKSHSIKREKILIEFLQRLRRIYDNHNQNNKNDNNNVNKKVPKKILICSNQLLSNIFSLNFLTKKRRRQTSFHKSSMLNNHNNEFRPEFDELDMSDFDLTSPATSTSIDYDINDENSILSSSHSNVLANSHKMLPSFITNISVSNELNHSLLSTISPMNNDNKQQQQQQQQQRQKNNRKLNNINKNNGNRKSSITIDTKSIYHYFDLIHFELNIRPNHIDTIRDQVNYIFLNRPNYNFPTIMWSVGSITNNLRLVNRIDGSNYLIASLFILTMMPGTINIFYGDEIGLSNIYHNSNHYNDHHSIHHQQQHHNNHHNHGRYHDNNNDNENNILIGGHLIPMAWTSDSPNANFSLPNVTLSSFPSTSSSLSIHPDYAQINVEKRSDWVKIVSDLINFRLDFLYNHPLSIENDNNTKLDMKSSSKSQHYQQQPLNYLFHYIDHTTICLEQYFDRKQSTDNHLQHRRYRYVLFANLGNETIIKDFSDKFHFSSIQLATNVNRTNEFLIMKSLQLDPGEAMIAIVE